MPPANAHLVTDICDVFGIGVGGSSASATTIGTAGIVVGSAAATAIPTSATATATGKGGEASSTSLAELTHGCLLISAIAHAGKSSSTRACATTTGGLTRTTMSREDFSTVASVASGFTASASASAGYDDARLQRFAESNVTGSTSGALGGGVSTGRPATVEATAHASAHSTSPADVNLQCLWNIDEGTRDFAPGSASAAGCAVKLESHIHGSRWW